jgi:serine/threonine protein kinase
MSTKFKEIGTYVGPEDNRNKYLILEAIGFGNFGEVYRGLNMVNGKEMAIKVLSEKDWKRETSCLKKILNICKSGKILCIEDYFSFNNNNYIVTQYLKNYITMNKFLDSKQKVSEDQANDISEQIQLVLNQMKDLGVAHGDLNLNNIMIHPKTLHVVIIDLGKCIFRDTNDDKELLEMYQFDQNNLEYIKRLLKNMKFNMGEAFIKDEYYWLPQSFSWSDDESDENEESDEND